MPLYIAAILIMIVVDQVVKHWAFTVLQPQHTIPLIENVFHLTYIENRGAAFSMFAKFDSRWIFVALASVITLAICYTLSKKLMQTALGSWSLVLIAAGAGGHATVRAVGNAIDRVARGFVVDMFDFRLIHFPVFNVADIFICVGGVLFVIYFMFQHKDKPNDKNEAVNDNE